MNMVCLLLILNLVWACKTENQPPIPFFEDVFYVAPTGSDNNSGSFEHPWATWQMALSMAGPGDTVFIRGGIYFADAADQYGVYATGKNGSAASPICIFNYPGEVPVLDCSRITSKSSNKGILLYNCRYIHLKGLTVTGVSQHAISSEALGFAFERGGPYIVERCVSHNNEGAGFWGYALDTIYLIQCDSYNNFDRFTQGYSGGQADGYVFCFASNTSYTYYSECRSWFNSDDGYDCWKNEGTVVFENCWAFNNGRGDGDGGGFKLGRTDEKPLAVPQRTLHNCMAFYNRFIGFNQNDGNVSMRFYNNIAFANDRIGFDIGQFNNPIIARNNISYRNGSIGNFISTNNDHNSWNASAGVTVSDDDFVSVDSTGVSGKRQSNGSLPVLSFLKLTKGSDLINAGIDVGLLFKGSAPDLGPFEME